MLGKVPPTKLRGVHFVPSTLIPSDYSYEEAINDEWCGRKWNKEEKKIIPEVCSYHPMTCWSCNPDVAGWTCKECPEPYSPAYNWRIAESQANNRMDPEDFTLYSCRRCNKCNTTYAKVKRYNRIFKRLTQWKRELPGLIHFRFNTLTTRSDKVPQDQGEKYCQDLLKDFKALARRNAWSNMIGSIVVGEVKNRDDGTCHPHLHAITMWNKKPDYKSTDNCLKKEKTGKIHHIHWCYLGDMEAGIKKYIQKYFLKDPVKLGGSKERPRIWMTYGMARKDVEKYKGSIDFLNPL